MAARSRRWARRSGRIDDPLLRAEIAAFDVDALAFAAMSERFIDQLKAGEAHPAMPSMMKYAGTELNKRRHELVMAAGGSDALEWDSERSKGGKAAARLAPHQGQFDRGRDQRNPARHRRQAYPPPAGSLTDDDPDRRPAHARTTRVAPFMAEEGAIKKQLRHWRDTGCKDGFGHGLWKQFAELGLTGILIPEAQGGAGLGEVEAGVVLEEIGRNLTPSPFLTTAVAAVRALEGSRQAERWFPGHRRGRDGRRAGDRRGQASRSRRASRWRPSGRATASRLTGAKQFVVHGASADVILVAARTAGSRGRDATGITLFAVEREREGPGRSTMSRWPTASRRRG